MTLSRDPCVPVEARDVPAWHAETDVLVVGFGGAGACAALEASACGARVIVLEAASEGGGTTALSGGQIYLGGGTPIQQACGFSDTPEAMYEYLIRASGPNADPERVRLYVDGSLGHFDWLVAQGMELTTTARASASGLAQAAPR